MTEKTLGKVSFDRGYLGSDKKYIVGVDEVGRGPLAGPVVCCYPCCRGVPNRVP